MDVNMQPRAGGAPRVDGVEFERPDHEGLMFDSFLTIANGFGLIERPAQDMTEPDRDDELIEDNVDDELKRQQKRAHTKSSADQRADNSTLSDQSADQSRDMRKLLEDKPDRVEDQADVSGRQEIARGSDDAANGTDGQAKSKRGRGPSEATKSVESKEQVFVEDSETALLSGKHSEMVTQTSDSAPVLEENTVRVDDLLKVQRTDTSEQHNDSADSSADVEMSKLASNELSAKKVASAIGDDISRSLARGQQRTDTNAQPKHIEQVSGANTGVGESRFAHEALPERANQQLNSMSGQLSLNGADGASDTDGMQQQEWARLLQQAPTAMSVDSKASGAGKDVSSLSQVVKSSGPDGGVVKVPNGTQAGQTLQQRRNTATPQKAQQSAMTRQLPDGVDELSILRQISDGLKLKSGRLQRAQIRLNPEELGTVDIKMQMKGDSVRVSVTTEHPGVVDVLSSGLEQLKREILAQGLHIEHIEVNSQLAGDQSRQEFGASERDETAQSDADEAQVETVTRSHDGILNVRA